jgi:hypothetical protein
MLNFIQYHPVWFAYITLELFSLLSMWYFMSTAELIRDEHPENH